MTQTTSLNDLGERLQAALGSGYEVKDELGGGGMSRVFGVRDIALNRDIVVKVLPPELTGELSAERFKREIQFAASLQHPHIVPVHAAGDADGLPYYTMPRVEGTSLRDHLTRRQRLSVNEALAILRDIARALAYAHRRGIVHRDIKPDNVLVADNMAVVTDFGIAKAIAAAREDEHIDMPVASPTRPGLTMTGTSLGTPEYMAPEQVAGDPGMDHRVDLYALGVVGYELLAGRPPFYGRTPREQLTAQMSERPRDLAELRLDLAPAVSGLIMRALEKDPSARPESAEVMVRELDAAIAGTSAPVSADEPEIIRRAFGWYVVSFAAAAGIAWTAMQVMGLPDWVFPGAIALMALGLPVVAFTALARYAAYQAVIGADARRSGSQWVGSRSLWAAQYLSWRRITIGGATSLGGFGLLVGGVMATRNLGIGPAASLFGQGTLREQERLLVTDFTAAGADSGLVAAVTLAARTGLQQSRAVSVLSGDLVDQALDRMRRPRNTRIDLALGRELAMREGLRAVVSGHIVRAGSGYDVGIRLVSADSGRELAAFHRGARTLDDILPAVDKLTRDLRGKIGESLRNVRATPPLPQVTSTSIKALQLYADALRAERLKALGLLREAVALDSEFAMAYTRIWGWKAFTPEGDSALVRAVRYRSRLSERERLMVDALHYITLYLFPDADRNRAVAAREQLAALGDETGVKALPAVYHLMRQFARAESLNRINVRRFPEDPNPREQLVSDLIELNRLDDAERVLDSALKVFPRHWPLRKWKIRMLYYRGNLDAFERALDGLNADPDLNKRGYAMDMRAQMALMRGRVRESDRLLSEARTINQATNDRGATQSDLERAKVELWREGMRRRYTSATVRLVDELQRTTPPPANTREVFAIAFTFAHAERPDIARRYLESYLAVTPDSLVVGYGKDFIHWARYFIALAENRPREALEERRLGETKRDGFPSPCQPCLYRDLGLAYDKLGDADSTILMYERFVNEPSWWTLHATNAVLPTGALHHGDLHNYLRRLGELYEAKGNRAKAIEYYSRFVELWKNADPELQPQVADIRARLVRLRSG